jgi:hypothetical protein
VIIELVYVNVDSEEIVREETERDESMKRIDLPKNGGEVLTCRRGGKEGGKE